MVFYTPMMVTVATKLEVPIKLLFPRPDNRVCVPPVSDSLEAREYLTCVTGGGKCVRPDVVGVEAVDEFLKCLAKKRSMAMLGLGDIVVPGIMIAFALRFDLYRYYLKLGRIESDRKQGVGQNQEKQIENKGQEKVDDVFKADGDKPVYYEARGMWAERMFTARKLWSTAMKAKEFPKVYFWTTVGGYFAGMVATILVMQVWQHAQPALLYLVPGVLGSFWGMAMLRGEVKLLWNFDEAEEEKEKEEIEKKKKDADEKEKESGKDLKEDKMSKKSESQKDTEVGERKSSDGNEKSVISLNVFLPGHATRSTKKTEKTA